MTTSTLWGPSQTEEQSAPGIMYYTTAGHGGFHLSDERRKQLPKAFAELGSYGAADGWYEEDCNWCIVVLAFPQFFKETELEQALKTCRDWLPETYAEWQKEQVTA